MSFQKDNLGSQCSIQVLYCTWTPQQVTSQLQLNTRNFIQIFHSTTGKYSDLTGVLLINSPFSKKQPPPVKHEAAQLSARNSWKQGFGPLPKKGWRALKALLALGCHVFRMAGIHSTPLSFSYFYPVCCPQFSIQMHGCALLSLIHRVI